MNLNKNSFLALIAFTALSCGGPGGIPEPTDTPTSGEVSIVVDESYSLLFDTQIYTFQSLYPRAKVNARYLAETEALKMLVNDSCKVIVLNRDLTADERKYFESNNLFPKTTKIAEDAIALVVNNENTDTILTVDRFRSILQGLDTSWAQLNPASKLGHIHVVFDNQGSANARYLQDSLLGGKDFAKNVYAVHSNPEVIDHISKNKNAIGVLSVNWISDKDDSLSRGFLSKVKVMGLKRADTTKAFKPYQAYIKTKEYPFCRDVCMINRQTRAGLGMGFVSFVAGEKGQLIILKSGLIPAISPVRIVEMKIE